MLAVFHFLLLMSTGHLLLSVTAAGIGRVQVFDDDIFNDPTSTEQEEAFTGTLHDVLYGSDESMEQITYPPSEHLVQTPTDDEDLELVMDYLRDESFDKTGQLRYASVPIIEDELVKDLLDVIFGREEYIRFLNNPQRTEMTDVVKEMIRIPTQQVLKQQLLHKILAARAWYEKFINPMLKDNNRQKLLDFAQHLLDAHEKGTLSTKDTMEFNNHLQNIAFFDRPDDREFRDMVNKLQAVFGKSMNVTYNQEKTIDGAGTMEPESEISPWVPDTVLKTSSSSEEKIEKEWNSKMATVEYVLTTDYQNTNDYQTTIDEYRSTDTTTEPYIPTDNTEDYGTTPDEQHSKGATTEHYMPTDITKDEHHLTGTTTEPYIPTGTTVKEHHSTGTKTEPYIPTDAITEDYGTTTDEHHPTGTTTEPFVSTGTTADEHYSTGVTNGYSNEMQRGNAFQKAATTERYNPTDITSEGYTPKEAATGSYSTTNASTEESSPTETTPGLDTLTDTTMGEYTLSDTTTERYLPTSDSFSTENGSSGVTSGYSHKMNSVPGPNDPRYIPPPLTTKSAKSSSTVSATTTLPPSPPSSNNSTAGATSTATTTTEEPIVYVRMNKDFEENSNNETDSVSSSNKEKGTSFLNGMEDLKMNSKKTENNNEKPLTSSP